MHKYGSGKYLQQTDPIKPRAVKAQIKPIFPTGSTGTLNNFNNFSQSFRNSNVWFVLFNAFEVLQLFIKVREKLLPLRKD